MAMLPELSKLRVAPLAGEKVWPILQTENVFILPGVPEFFQSKMSVIADHFLDARPMVSGALLFLYHGGVQGDDGVDFRTLVLQKVDAALLPSLCQDLTTRFSLLGELCEVWSTQVGTLGRVVPFLLTMLGTHGSVH